MLPRALHAGLLLLVSFRAVRPFIIENKFVGPDGVKVFTVSNVIKGNECTCACNCAKDDVPLEKPLPAPAPPIAEAPKQFVIRKVIRKNHCNCACSCVPREGAEVDEGIKKSFTAPAPQVHDAVKEQVLHELKTTIENSYRTTPVQHATSRPANPPASRESLRPPTTAEPPTTRGFWQTSTPPTIPSVRSTTGYVLPSTSTQFAGYFTGPPPREDPRATAGSPWNTQPTGSSPLQPAWSSPLNPWTATGVNEAPTLPPIQWPSSSASIPAASNQPPSPSESTREPEGSPSNGPSGSPHWWSTSVVSPSTLPKRTETTGGKWPPTGDVSGWLSTTPHLDRSSPPSQRMRPTEEDGRRAGSSTRGFEPEMSGTQTADGRSGSTPTAEQTPSGERSTTQSGRPTITEDDEIATRTVPNEQRVPARSTAQPTGQPVGTTEGRSREEAAASEISTPSRSSSPSSSTAQQQAPSERPPVPPGLEISPGRPDSMFGHTVVVNTADLESLPTTPTGRPIDETTGQQSTPAAANRTVISAEAIDELANTVAAGLDESTRSSAGGTSTSIPEKEAAETSTPPASVGTTAADQNSTLSPEFKLKVYRLLTDLKAQLQKMKANAARRPEEAKEDEQQTTTSADRPTTSGSEQKLADFDEQLQTMVEEAKNRTEPAEERKNAEKSRELMKKLYGIRAMLNKMKTSTTLPASSSPTTSSFGTSSPSATSSSSTPSSSPSTTTRPLDTTTPSETILSTSTAPPTSAQSSSTSTSPPPSSALSLRSTAILQTTATPVQQPNGTQKKANEFDSIATTVVVEEELETTTERAEESGEKREFIRKLHTQLLKLKDRLEEMRKTTPALQPTTTLAPPAHFLSTEATVAPPEEERKFHYDDLKTRLANLKNTLDSLKTENEIEAEQEEAERDDESSTELMRDQMRSMLVKLKAKLNELKEQEAAAQRTTVGVATTTSFTPPPPQSEVTLQSTSGNLRPTHSITSPTTASSTSGRAEETTTSASSSPTPPIEATPATTQKKDEAETTSLSGATTREAASSPPLTRLSHSSTTTSSVQQPSTTPAVQLEEKKEVASTAQERVATSVLPNTTTSEQAAASPLVITKQPTVSEVSTLITEIESRLNEKTEATHTLATFSARPSESPTTLVDRPTSSKSTEDSERTTTIETTFPTRAESSTTSPQKSSAKPVDLPTSSESSNSIQPTTTSRAKEEGEKRTKGPAFVQSTDEEEQTEQPPSSAQPTSAPPNVPSTTQPIEEPRTTTIRAAELSVSPSTTAELPPAFRIETTTADSEQPDDGRRGLEITKLFKPSASKGGALGFSDDDADEQTFIDRGDGPDVRIEQKSTSTSPSITPEAPPTTPEVTTQPIEPSTPVSTTPVPLQSTTTTGSSFKIDREPESAAGDRSEGTDSREADGNEVSSEDPEEPSRATTAPFETVHFVDVSENETKAANTTALPDWYKQPQLGPELVKLGPEIARLILNTASISPLALPNLPAALPNVPAAVPELPLSVPEVPPVVPNFEARRRVNIRPTTAAPPPIDRPFRPPVQQVEEEAERPATTASPSKRPKGRNSDELYDDYEDHRPTLPPNAPTRRPKLRGQAPAKPQVDEKQPASEFSVDGNSNKIVDGEMRIPRPPSESLPSDVQEGIPSIAQQPTVENALKNRLEEARRLREQLELEAMHEKTEAQSGIQFQQHAARRAEIERRLAELAEAERWQRLLLEKAHLKQRVYANANGGRTDEMETAPTAKPIATTTPAVPPALPAHCGPVRRFLSLYHVADPRLWVRENCEAARRMYPQASCAQIEELLAVCFTIPLV